MAVLLTATLGVAILHVLVMASFIFLGGGRFSLDAKLLSRWQPATALQNELRPSHDH